MESLTKAIINYLKKDTNKITSLNEMLTEELEKIKLEQKKEKELNTPWGQLNAKLLGKIEKEENEIKKINEDIKIKEKMFLVIYKERIQNLFDIYNSLKNFQSKSNQMFKEDILSRLTNPKGSLMRFDFSYFLLKDVIHFHVVKELKEDNDVNHVNSIWYITPNGIGIINRYEFGNDTTKKIIKKDLYVVEQIEKEFLKFEKYVNQIVEDLLNEED